MDSGTSVNISDVVDNSTFGRFQLLVAVLCGTCMIMDGFDVQAIGYAAPSIIKEWGVTKASFGPVFGAGLFGMFIGSLALSPVADRFGRRPVLIAATLFLAACMAATAHASSVGELAAWRFITGLWLGAIIPNCIALAAEYSPVRMRVTLMMVISSGFIVGGAVGGTIAAVLIPMFGWKSVFYAGAGAALLISLAMMRSLPESMQFLVVRRRDKEKVHEWLRRMVPDHRYPTCSAKDELRSPCCSGF
jgi:AAHS family 4-hydroxybenzoate transporter-like MFS transporter